MAEAIPWNCRRLVIGTGTGALPVMDEVKQEAARRQVKLVIVPTEEAIATLKKHEPTRFCTSRARRRIWRGVSWDRQTKRKVTSRRSALSLSTRRA
jgi:hypothetical protein